MTGREEKGRRKEQGGEKERGDVGREWGRREEEGGDPSRSCGPLEFHLGNVTAYSLIRN